MVPRDPRQPMVCVSLCHADWPQAADDMYEIGVEPATKKLRFLNLLHSHAQHARLLQALYRQCRSTQQARMGMEVTQGLFSQARDAAVDTRALSPDKIRTSNRDRLGEARRHSSFSDNGTADAPAGGSESAQLRRDIQSTRREASLKIGQAGDTLRTLKERVLAKQTEHEQLRKETLRFRREADALEMENRQLALQLEQHVPERSKLEDSEDEMRRLRREAGVLAEQKQALVQILEDLYGTVGARGQPPVPADALRQGLSAGPAGGGAEPEPGHGEETWTHMLPRPSELFAGGMPP